ncbi:MAG: peptide chain release factor N(5)-glutamine methyltransferase [Saprospiraceae bacterium]|nr:peptide chain release factor N(5)-glutamine methyltransferase [Saprospiraceae bacterium]
MNGFNNGLIETVFFDFMSKEFSFFKNKLRKTLEQFFEVRESENIAKIYFEDRFQIKGNSENVFSEQFINIFDQDLERFKLQEPVQYITGKAWFYKYLFLVNDSVLIPRPETEELVKYILDLKPFFRNPEILDIGTGSGCIALSIGKEWHDAKIKAIEISADAIKIAERNKSGLKANNVNFECWDFLDEKNWKYLDKFDIIVSNPPYIPFEEASEMDFSTLNYEPKIALFPEGQDHLIFYRKIIDFATNHLNPGGKILCEINEFHAAEISNMMSTYNLRILKDIRDKDRILEVF